MNNNQLISTLYMVGLFAIIYLFMFRPQQQQAKKKKQLLESLKEKDTVVTAGGIYGSILKVKDDTVILRIAEKVEVEVLKNAIVMKTEESK